MAHRPHAAGSAPSVAPPEMHPLCRECAGVSTIDEASPRPPETVLRVSDRLHRYACADMEWCCMCGYRTDAGYYLVPLMDPSPAVERVEWEISSDRALPRRKRAVVQEFECVAMKTPEEEMARAMAQRAKLDRKREDDRTFMEDALAKLKGESFVEIARQKLFQEAPLSVYIPPGGGVPQLVDPPLTYEEVRMRHDRDESDGARGRKHRDRAWLLDSLEQAEQSLRFVDAECKRWEALFVAADLELRTFSSSQREEVAELQAGRARCDCGGFVQGGSFVHAESCRDGIAVEPEDAEAGRATERCAPGDDDDHLDHPDPRCDG